MPIKRAKLPISNSDFKNARFVVIGVPDDSGSSYRNGSDKAPDAIRRVANSNELGEVVRNGKKSIFEPELSKLNAKVFDYGNVRKDGLKTAINKICKNGKLPIVIGGDHSITYKTISSISTKKRFSFVYFDAHPDFICSRRNYFGSVVCDISMLKNVDIKSSVIVGVRAIEDEEIDDIRKSGIKVITATDVVGLGAKKVVDVIKKTVSSNVYISVDLDVVDPAFAPGVTTPVVGGISSDELLYFIRGLAGYANMGLDVMEVCPKYDRKDVTSYLAYRTILEFISEKR